VWRALWEWVNRAASIVQLWPVLSSAAVVAVLSGILTYLSRMPWWGILITEVVVFGGIIAGGVWMVRRQASVKLNTVQPVGMVGDLDMHRRRKRFWEQVRDMQREVHDSPGHELRRLLEHLGTEIAGNLKYQPAAPERAYLTAVLDHLRASKAENDDPELTKGLQNLSAAYSAVQSYRPPPQGRAFFRPPAYQQEAEAVLALIQARANL
jgi:hypothetical protein